MTAASALVQIEHDHVVVVVSPSGRRTPFGPHRPERDARDLAAKLARWGMRSVVERGRVECGEFVAEVAA